MSERSQQGLNKTVTNFMSAIDQMPPILKIAGVSALAGVLYGCSTDSEAQHALIQVPGLRGPISGRVEGTSAAKYREYSVEFTNPNTFRQKHGPMKGSTIVEPPTSPNGYIARIMGTLGNGDHVYAFIPNETLDRSYDEISGVYLVGPNNSTIADMEAAVNNGYAGLDILIDKDMVSSNSKGDYPRYIGGTTGVDYTTTRSVANIVLGSQNASGKNIVIIPDDDSNEQVIIHEAEKTRIAQIFVDTPTPTATAIPPTPTPKATLTPISVDSMANVYSQTPPSRETNASVRPPEQPLVGIHVDSVPLLGAALLGIVAGGFAIFVTAKAIQRANQLLRRARISESRNAGAASTAVAAMQEADHYRGELEKVTNPPIQVVERTELQEADIEQEYTQEPESAVARSHRAPLQFPKNPRSRNK